MRGSNREPVEYIKVQSQLEHQSHENTENEQQQHVIVKKCKILPSHGGKLRISRRVKYVDFDTSPRLANFEILTVQILDGGGIIGIELSC